MSRLYNNPSYPAVDDPAEIAPALNDAHTRAVFYTDPRMPKTIRELAPAITASNNATLASAYQRISDDGTREKSAGRVHYMDAVTMDQVQAEADSAGIQIANDHNSLALLTRRINQMRNVFTQAYREYSGDTDSAIVTHLLFTPKGGIGRSPMLHVDNLPLTGHWSAALSSLEIMIEEPPAFLWEMLDKRKTNKLPKGANLPLQASLSAFVKHNPQDFERAALGDLLILKGQKLRDLSNPLDRACVCVHTSDRHIAEEGQAAAMFYPKRQIK
ncbi:MAG: hypothetical protein GC136_09575 [Alphaproteobacteria bacterium]|nr:hypothetical protein [Alphaproteobacteria bacterium]